MCQKEKQNNYMEPINFAMIKIGNIPWEISTRDVVELISPFLWKSEASQNWVHIPIDRITGKTLSDLFVEIPTEYEAIIICSNLNRGIMKQRALSVTMSSYDELFTCLVRVDSFNSGFFITSDEVNKILDICINYKIHFSRKCAERPFEHILSLFRMIPWQAIKPATVDLMFEMIKKAIESLETHLKKATNQFDEGLLPRMMSVAQSYPGFSNEQKKEFHKKAILAPEIENNINSVSRNFWIKTVQ